MKLTKRQLKEMIREAYSDEKIRAIGREYEYFMKLLRNANYTDFMDYAETAGHHKSLEILHYLKKRTKFI